MKRVLLLAFAVFYGIAGICQGNYRWLYWGRAVKGGSFDEFHFLINGDTKNGSDMVQYEGDGKGCPPYGGKNSKGIMDVKWKDGRVLMKKEDYMTLIEPPPYALLGNKEYTPYKETDDGYLVLYDFNMQVGDAYPHVEGYEDIIVSRIDYMTTRDGVSRKLLTLSNGYQVLEGVGCLNSPGLFYFYLNPAQNPEDWGVIGLKNFCGFNSESEREWEIIYQEDDERILGIISANNKSATSNTLYDLQGHRINGKPERGVYIQNGKKYFKIR